MKDRREIFKNKRAAGTSPGCGKDKKTEEVKVWQEDVHIPTYEPGEPQKNPMFLEGRVYQGSSGKVYPYPVRRQTQICAVPSDFLLYKTGGDRNYGSDETGQ